MIGERLKGIGASLINAVGFIIVFFLFTAVIGSMVGEGFKDLSLDNLGEAIAQNDVTVGLLVAGFFIGTGLLVVLFGRYVRPRVAMLLGAEDQESTTGTELEYTKKAILVTILTLFVVGIVVIMFITAFNSFLGNIHPDINIIDFETLTSAITMSDPGFWFWYIIGLLILATIVDVFGRNTTRISAGITNRL